MESDEIEKAVLEVLEENDACIVRELSDRLYDRHGYKYGEVHEALNQLESEGSISKKVEPSPYGIPFHFYSKAKTNKSYVKETVKRKLGLLNEHNEIRNDAVSKLGENLVATAIEKLGYTEIETRKKTHQGTELEKDGINRRDIDVWGKHPDPRFGYQCIEVKNRNQLVGESDIEHVWNTAELASKKWGLDLSVELNPAIVCRSAWGNAFKESHMPIVMTGKVYVSDKHRSFYKEYKETFGAYYIEPVKHPPKTLVEGIKKFAKNYRGVI